MRSNGFIFLIGILFLLLTDTFLYIQIRSYLRQRMAKILYILQSLFFVAGMFAYHFLIPVLKGPKSYFWIEWGIGLLFLFYLPKVIFVLLNAVAWLTGRLSRMTGKILRYSAGILSVLLFFLLLYSLTLGRYNYQLETVRICRKDLPAAFEGFKIIQLSDLHLGSYSPSYPGIPRLISEVNALNPDVIVFTGDMVNNFASEITPWIPQLQQLKAKYGKFAVTGNHDYGNYTRWPDPRQKEQNLADFYRNMKAAGFTMLNNTHAVVAIGKDTIYLAGVENWGNPPFPRYGNLSAALQGTEKGFTILLSHDPSHWRAEVLQTPVALTLSGHTHAMQMGIQWGKYRWSPARYIYPEYDGLYEEGKHFLHVSRGQGYLGYPGRIGLPPVITEIILSGNCR